MLPMLPFETPREKACGSNYFALLRSSTIFNTKQIINLNYTVKPHRFYSFIPGERDTLHC